MKRPQQLTDLLLFLQRQKINISSEQSEKLAEYYKNLISYSHVHRIISKNDTQFIVEKHFLSSFYFVKEIKNNIDRGDYILDLGSGAGFPGIILSIFFENNHIVLIDSVRKKTLFLKKIVRDLNLNCEIINDRIENYKDKSIYSFKFITARAVAGFDELYSLAYPFLQNAELHSIKGEDFEKEIRTTAAYNYSFYKIDTVWQNYSEYLKDKVYLKIRL